MVGTRECERSAQRNAAPISATYLNSQVASVGFSAALPEKPQAPGRSRRVRQFRGLLRTLTVVQSAQQDSDILAERERCELQVLDSFAAGWCSIAEVSPGGSMIGRIRSPVLSNASPCRTSAVAAEYS